MAAETDSDQHRFLKLRGSAHMKCIMQKCLTHDTCSVLWFSHCFPLKSRTKISCSFKFFIKIVPSSLCCRKEIAKSEFLILFCRDWHWANSEHDKVCRIRNCSKSSDPSRHSHPGRGEEMATSRAHRAHCQHTAPGVSNFDVLSSCLSLKFSISSSKKKKSPGLSGAGTESNCNPDVPASATFTDSQQSLERWDLHIVPISWMK